MTSREMFEKFFMTTYATYPAITRRPDGEYVDEDVEFAWKAWLMSASYRHEGELE